MAQNYKGNLTENEKRQLDFFRMQEKHPVADYDSLPEEVQRYINRITMEHYDLKSDKCWTFGYKTFSLEIANAQTQSWLNVD
jgi:hypothetical protein